MTEMGHPVLHVTKWNSIAKSTYDYVLSPYRWHPPTCPTLKLSASVNPSPKAITGGDIRSWNFHST